MGDRLGKISIMCLILLMFLVSYSNAASGVTLQANVTVACPFYLALNALPLYVRVGNVNMNYTVVAQAQCAVQNLQGNFILKYKGNGTVVYTNTLTVNTVNQTPATYNLLPINSLTLQPDNYVATINFIALHSSNSSSKTFALLNSANIIVTGFSANPSSVDLNLPITLSVTLLNDGQLASSTIGVNIIITGPKNLNITGSASALSPGQNEQVNFVLSNVTSMVGTYTARTGATYLSNNAIKISNTKNITYVVTSPPPPSGGGPPPTTPPPPYQVIADLPQISFTQLPFSVSLFINSTVVTNIRIKNIMHIPESISLRVPKVFSSIISLSATNVTLLPNQSVLIQALFSSKDIQFPDVYVIPVNITIRNANGTSSTTQYLTYSIQNTATNLTLSYKTYFDLGNATVVLTLTNPTNTSFRDLSVTTQLPPSIISNISQIGTSGVPNNVSIVNGVPTIDWLVPYVQSGGEISMSYMILKPIHIGLLTQSQNFITTLSKPAPTDILRLINVQVPTFYTNSSNLISVSALYTGTSQQSVAFSLFSQGTLTVINSIQTVNATPNQLLDRSFHVLTNNATGTLILTLSIATNGASLNYTIPVLVLQKPALITTTTIPQAMGLNVYALQYLLSLFGVIAVFAVIATLRASINKRRRQRLKPEIAKELRNIKEQIRRSDEHTNP